MTTVRSIQQVLIAATKKNKSACSMAIKEKTKQMMVILPHQVPMTTNLLNLNQRIDLNRAGAAVLWLEVVTANGSLRIAYRQTRMKTLRQRLIVRCSTEPAYLLLLITKPIKSSI